MDGRRIGPFRQRPDGGAKLRAAPPPPPVPQFETAPLDGPAVFVRARSPEDAVRDAAGRGGAVDVEVGAAAPGSGWRDAAVDGEPWGRVRPRDRMRFRRD